MKSTRLFARSHEKFVQSSSQTNSASQAKRLMRLGGDWALLAPTTKPFVERFACDERAFFASFAQAFTKLASRGYHAKRLQTCAPDACTLHLDTSTPSLEKPVPKAFNCGKRTFPVDAFDCKVIDGEVEKCRLVGGAGQRGLIECGSEEMPRRYACCKDAACSFSLKGFRYLETTAFAPTPQPDGWQLVFRQSAKNFDPWWGCLSKNPHDPEADNYSILDQLENMRGPDGKLTFSLRWPDSYLGENSWKQISNPTQVLEWVEGYEALSIACKDGHWGGLALSGSNVTRLDGSIGHDSSWFSIMRSELHDGGIPACEDKVADKVELFVYLG